MIVNICRGDALPKKVEEIGQIDDIKTIQRIIIIIIT